MQPSSVVVFTVKSAIYGCTLNEWLEHFDQVDEVYTGRECLSIAGALHGAAALSLEQECQISNYLHRSLTATLHFAPLLRHIHIQLLLAVECP